MSSERLSKSSEQLIMSSRRLDMSSEPLINLSDQVILSALKFSRSPYLDNHLSEGINTCTICTCTL